MIQLNRLAFNHISLPLFHPSLPLRRPSGPPLGQKWIEAKPIKTDNQLLNSWLEVDAITGGLIYNALEKYWFAAIKTQWTDSIINAHSRMSIEMKLLCEFINLRDVILWLGYYKPSIYLHGSKLFFFPSFFLFSFLSTSLLTHNLLNVLNRLHPLMGLEFWE